MFEEKRYWMERDLRWGRFNAVSAAYPGFQSTIWVSLTHYAITCNV